MSNEAKMEEFISYIENMTVRELSDLVKALEDQLGHTVHTSPLTQYVGALGAAVFAYRLYQKENKA